jgi:hypothetical protein
MKAQMNNIRRDIWVVTDQTLFVYINQRLHTNTLYPIMFLNHPIEILHLTIGLELVKETNENK